MTCRSPATSLAGVDNSPGSISLFERALYVARSQSAFIRFALGDPLRIRQSVDFGAPHVSEFPKRQIACSCAKSLPRAGWSKRLVRQHSRLQRSCDGLLIGTSRPDCHRRTKVNTHVEYFRSLLSLIPHIEQAQAGAAARMVWARDALSLSPRRAVFRVDGLPLKSWLFRFRRGPRCPSFVSH